MPTAVVVGTADRLTPPVQAQARAAALPHHPAHRAARHRPHDARQAPEPVTGKIRELVHTHIQVVSEESA
ncbi:Pimeloyl-ACP methyl ester carboxylesterase OS=Streptomyces violarus OX=67380 GN=FHS41_006769 PE=4 SV=1 [Streptomyces violarus]